MSIVLNICIKYLVPKYFFLATFNIIIFHTCFTLCMDIKQIFNSCYKCEEISYEPHGPKYFSRQTSHKLHWNIQYNLHLIAIISYKNQFLSSKLREKKSSQIKLV